MQPCCSRKSWPRLRRARLRRPRRCCRERRYRWTRCLPGKRIRNPCSLAPKTCKKASAPSPSGGRPRFLESNAMLNAAADTMRAEIETVPQYWPRLAEYLAGLNMQLDLDTPPQQFAGGFANLNYRIQLDGKPAVLRRPPKGPLPAGAYDMAREFQILSRL